MRKTLFVCLWGFMAIACTKSQQFTIEGKLPNHSYDGKYVYLASAEPPFDKKDSTLINDASFTFVGSKEEMRIVRLGWRDMYGLQNLLVVTEPKKISVTIDTVSTASGTPQNDALQAWKEQKEKTAILCYNLRKEIKNAVSPSDSLNIANRQDSLRDAFSVYTYDFLKAQKDNTLGKTLYRMIRFGFSEEQQTDLDSIMGYEKKVEEKK